MTFRVATLLKGSLDSLGACQLLHAVNNVFHVSYLSKMSPRRDQTGVPIPPPSFPSLSHDAESLCHLESIIFAPQMASYTLGNMSSTQCVFRTNASEYTLQRACLFPDARPRQNGHVDLIFDILNDHLLLGMRPARTATKRM